MRFSNKRQQSLEQIAFIEKLVRQDRLTWEDALFVATELVKHGSPNARHVLNNYKKQLGYPHHQHYLELLIKHDNFISSISGLREIQGDRRLFSELYKLDGYLFLRGDNHPEKLLVVFTTIFNNFYISNCVLYAILRNFGISVLFLKDPSLFVYLNGVSGFGDNIEQVAQNVVDLARRERISEVYITGFSSGGYASLFASCLLPCSGYLGFSIASDLSEGSAIDPGKLFTQAVRTNIDKKYLINVKNFISEEKKTVERRLYVGELSDFDRAHAANLSELPGIKLNLLRNCNHQTVEALMRDGSLTDVFHQLLF